MPTKITRTQLNLDCNTKDTNWFERSTGINNYSIDLSILNNFTLQAGDHIAIIDMAKPYNKNIFYLHHVNIQNQIRSLSASYPDLHEHYTARQRIALQDIHIHFSKNPFSNKNIEFYTLDASQSVLSDNPHIEPLTDTKITSGIPQTGDRFSRSGKQYKISNICWAISQNGTINKVRIYLIITPDAPPQYSEHTYQAKDTDAVSNNFLLFTNQPWERTNYLLYRNRVMNEYNRIAAQKIKRYFMDKTNIRTFREDYKTRIATSVAVNAGATAAMHFWPLPYFAVSTIWGMGVSDVSKYIYAFFSKTLHQSAPKSKLQEMVYTSEFKLEAFSKRLNFVYWEVMNKYESLVKQSHDIKMKVHAINHTEANLISPSITIVDKKNNMVEYRGNKIPHQHNEKQKSQLQAEVNHALSTNYAKTYAVWDGLREEALEYANFLEKLVKTMKRDLELMSESTEGQNAAHLFAQQFANSNMKNNISRLPVDLNTKPPAYS